MPTLGLARVPYYTSAKREKLVRTLCHALWVSLCSALVIGGSALLGAAQRDSTAANAKQPGATAVRDHQHDFDFEFGRWDVRIRRLLHPLAHSNVWVDYKGLSTVRKVWDGRANLGELEVDGPSAHLEGLSLRLYNPQSHQWSIFWANSKDGDLSKPMVGDFSNDRGEFYDQETYQGAAVYVRFIFSGITSTAFRLEQSFSADGGKTWEPNWVATFVRTGAQAPH